MQRHGSRHAALLLIVVSVILSSAPFVPSHADEWNVIRMNPGPTIMDLLILPDGQNGWAVGSTGAGGLVLTSVLRTTDGGAHWTVLPFPDATSAVLNGVSAVSASQAWVVGSSGRIYATTDAGQTWSSQPSGTSRKLSKVHFIDSMRGWACGGWQDGASYLVLHTTNGGAAWTNQSFGTTAYSCDDIFFADAQNGWVCGYDNTINGHIHHTTNGGVSWTRQTIPSGVGQVSSIDCPTALAGWAATSSLYASPAGAVLHTIDGGLTWTAETYTGQPYNYAIDCDGVNRVAVAAVNILSPIDEEVVYTTDGGETWNQSRPPIITYTFGMQMLGSGFWISAEYGQILLSTDLGVSWDWGYSGTLWKSVAWSDFQNGWIVAGSQVGTDGYCFRTTNGGATWARDRGAPGGAKVRWADSMTGWMLWEGTAASIWRTTDGGGSWSHHSIGGGNWIGGITFPTALRGWAYGASGTIRRTTDGGVTWSSQSSGTSRYVQAIAMVDANEGWAAGGYGGGNGFIRHTTDGGASWVAQTPASTDHFQAASFIDNQNGWLGAVNGAIHRTTNGGASWQIVGHVYHDYIDALIMKDALNGRLAARNAATSDPGNDGRGFIYHTTDGGVTWDLEYAQAWARGSVSDLAIQPNGRWWACGANDAILEQINPAGVRDAEIAGGPLRVAVMPNPVRSGAVVTFALGAQSAPSGAATLSIYDPLGRAVRVLSAAGGAAGSILWDARDASGRIVPDGIYLARLSSEGRTVTTRLCVVR